MGLHGLLQDSFTFIYADVVRTSRETHARASMACYGNSFTFLYVDDVHTSQETPKGLHGLSQGYLGCAHCQLCSCRCLPIPSVTQLAISKHPRFAYFRTTGSTCN
jgi:hypothetical protein